MSRRLIIGKLIVPISGLFVASLLFHSFIGQTAIAENQQHIASRSVGTSAISYVREDYTFFGLASYFNNVHIYIVSLEEIRQIHESTNPRNLQQGEWLAIVGRLKVYSFKAEGLSYTYSKTGLDIHNPNLLSENDSISTGMLKNEIVNYSAELEQLKFAHLFFPLAFLAKSVEAGLKSIQHHLFGNWGYAIIFLAAMVKIITLPITVATVRAQRHVSYIKSRLLPQLTKIKKEYDGEQAHHRIMEAHKNLGVSPFYSMKPMLGLFIQIPILIAAFNALGEMPELNGASFFWIDNLAYPDALSKFDRTVPMLGSKLSLLPILMAVVSIISVAYLQDQYATRKAFRNQKIRLYLMAGAFLVLFYPFPASMVLYWTVTNGLQLLQQKFLKF